jgi:hypothetical protein
MEGLAEAGRNDWQRQKGRIGRGREEGLEEDGRKDWQRQEGRIGLVR